MAALLPVAATALTAVDLLQRDRAARLAAQQSQAAARSRIAQLEADQATVQRRRGAALRAALAGARARFGARGIEASAGSGDAVLRGLIDESEAEAIDDFTKRQRRIDDLRRDSAYERELDLLARARRRQRSALGLFRKGAGPFD